MTGDDKRIFRFCAYALLLGLGLILLVGEMALWMTPPNDLDKDCLRKSLAEIDACVQAHNKKKEPDWYTEHQKWVRENDHWMDQFKDQRGKGG